MFLIPLTVPQPHLRASHKRVSSWLHKSPFLSDATAQWFSLAQSPHSKKVLGLIPSWGRALLCGVCMFSPCLRGFPPPSKHVCQVYLQSLPLTEALAKIWSWSAGAVLWLPTAPQGRLNAETKSLCMLYMWPIKYLFLFKVRQSRSSYTGSQTQERHIIWSIFKIKHLVLIMFCFTTVPCISINPVWTFPHFVVLPTGIQIDLNGLFTTWSHKLHSALKVPNIFYCDTNNN